MPMELDPKCIPPTMTERLTRQLIRTSAYVVNPEDTLYAFQYWALPPVLPPKVRAEIAPWRFAPREVV